MKIEGERKAINNISVLMSPQAAKKILQMTVLDYNFKPTKVINMDRNADRQLVYKVQLDGIAAHEWIPADILKEKYSKVQLSSFLFSCSMKIAEIKMLIWKFWLELKIDRL